MRDAIRANGVCECAGNHPLTSHFGEGLRAIFSGNDEVVHDSGWWLRDGGGKTGVTVSHSTGETLSVERASQDVERGFFNRFAEGWMGVAGASDVFARSAKGHHGSDFGEQVTGAWADNGGA